MERVETYSDIVWKQFRRNGQAYAALWSIVPLVATAILAPVLASDRPYVYVDEQGVWHWPLLRKLFNEAESVDFIFNMSLLALLPGFLIAFFRNKQWAAEQIPSRTRVVRTVLILLGLTVSLSVLFSLPGLRPTDFYRNRSFASELFESQAKYDALPSGQRDGTRPWAVFTPIPFGPFEQDLQVRYEKPFTVKPKANWTATNAWFPHLCGTDEIGRDVLVRMIYGTRISLTIGLVAVSIYLTIGCFLGSLAGYFGGLIDILISRVIEIILVFPAFFLILTLVGMMKPNIYLVMIVIGLTGWPTIARLTRGEVLKQRGLDYVSAVRALGFSHFRIIFRHVLPNSLSPALVAAPFGIASAITTEAGLAVLGFGVQPPAPTWGNLLKIGVNGLVYWWLIVFPAFGIFLTVTLFNLIGSGMRDAMDPRLRSLD